MSSNTTTADVEPEEVTQHASSEDDAGDPDDTNNLAHAEMIVSGEMTSDVTSDEYSSRIQELSDQVQTLRASIATALQERSEAEAQESLYGKRLDAEMSKSSTLKKDLRTSEMERIQLRDNLEQLEVVLQSESCSVPEHKLIKEELVELSNQHKQLEKQHKQQAIMLAEFQTENATLEVRLSNVGLEKPVTSVTESGRLLAHVASMQRRATMADTPPAFTTEASSRGDLDGDPQLDEDQGDIGLIAGSV
jgi:chromosome segregation ATPase